MSAGALNIGYIIDCAVMLNYNRRKANEDIKPTLSKAKWLKDFCTVHINIGRRTGKTEYIKSKINNKNTFIVVYDWNLKKEYEEKLSGNITNVFTFYDSRPHLLVNNIFNEIDLNDIQYVYVDEPKLSFRTQGYLDELYIIFSECKSEPTFIMLGE